MCTKKNYQNGAKQMNEKRYQMYEIQIKAMSSDQSVKQSVSGVDEDECFDDIIPKSNSEDNQQDEYGFQHFRQEFQADSQHQSQQQSVRSEVKIPPPSRLQSQQQSAVLQKQLKIGISQKHQQQRLEIDLNSNAQSAQQQPKMKQKRNSRNDRISMISCHEWSAVHLPRLREVLNSSIQEIEPFWHIWQEYERPIRLLQYKLFKQKDIYDLLYPHSLQITAQFCQKFGALNIYECFKKYRKEYLQTQPNSNNSQQQITRQFSHSFLKIFKLQHIKEDIVEKTMPYVVNEAKLLSQEGNNQRATVNLNDKKIPLNRFVSEHSAFYTGTSFYQDKIAVIHNQHRPARRPGRYIATTDNLSDFVAHIYEEDHLDLRCLGCAPYFYLNHSIHDDSLTKTPLNVFDDPFQIAKQAQDITAAIIAFLNCKGGVILFSVTHEYRTYRAQGKELNPTDKQNITNNILKLLSNIKGTSQQGSLKEMIKVDFVPIKKIIKGQTNNQNQAPTYLTPFKQKYYVTRIRICPQDSTLYYRQNSKKQRQFYRRHCGDVCEIKESQIDQFLKPQMERDLSIKAENQQLRCLSRQPQNCFEHDCLPPVDDQKGKDEAILALQQKIVNERRFKYMYLAVIRQRNIQPLKRKLQEHSFRVHLQTMYVRYHLKSAAYTTVLYADFDPQIAKGLSKKQEFIFEGKNLLLINIPNCLRLINVHEQRLQNLRADTYKTLLLWVAKEFPYQELKLCQFEGQDGNEYYLTTKTKSAALFVYYILNNYKEKTFMKTPKGFEELSPELKQQKWRVIESRQLIRT